MGDLNGLCTMSRELPSSCSMSAIVHEKMKKVSSDWEKGLNCQIARESISARL